MLGPPIFRGQSGARYRRAKASGTRPRNLPGLGCRRHWFGIGGVDSDGAIVMELLAQFYLVVRSQGLAIKLDVGQGPLDQLGWTSRSGFTGVSRQHFLFV